MIVVIIAGIVAIVIVKVISPREGRPVDTRAIAPKLCLKPARPARWILERKYHHLGIIWAKLAHQYSV